MIRIILAMLLGLSTWPQVAGAQSDRFDSIRGTIARFLDSTKSASVSVAVAKDGKIIWEESFGWADRARMVKATPNTMYSLASISKPITATGLMKLVEQGKVDIDHPANDYLGIGKITGRAGDASQATVKRVLSHTAGLPLHYQFFYLDQWGCESQSECAPAPRGVPRGYERPTMDETIARYGNVVFPPGVVYQYSNLGFGIIDYIIARVSGKTYADYMRSEVFLPLGMNHTSIDIAPGLEPYAAVRYDDRQRSIPFYHFDHDGASAVWSSAHDLVRFAMFHLKDRLPEQRPILKPETIDLMHTPVPPAQYGLGFAISNRFGYRQVSHLGGMPGVATTMYLYPDADLAVVALNNSEARPEAIAEAIAGLFLPHYADSLRVRGGYKRPEQPTFKPSADLVGEWTGQMVTWQKAEPLKLSVKDNGDVFIWVGDQLRAVVNDLEFTKDQLTGSFAGRMPTDDAGRWPHNLAFDLLKQGTTLKGWLNAMSNTEPAMGSLSAYAELTKR